MFGRFFFAFIKIEKMSSSFLNDFKINYKFDISKSETKYKGSISKKEGKKILKNEQETLRLLQEKLYADGSQSVLIVLQAMDAAGKASLIEHVFEGINPQGCEVTSFKTLSTKDYSHDFLWRHYYLFWNKTFQQKFRKKGNSSLIVLLEITKKPREKR